MVDIDKTVGVGARGRCAAGAAGGWLAGLTFPMRGRRWWTFAGSSFPSGTRAPPRTRAWSCTLTMQRSSWSRTSVSTTSSSWTLPTPSRRAPASSSTPVRRPRREGDRGWRPTHLTRAPRPAEEFYKFAATKLNPGGVLVTQSGPGSHFNITECFTAINQTLRRAFKCVVPLSADIPSFGSNWGFNIAFHAEGDAEEAVEGLVERSAKKTDALVAKRLSRPLRFYDGITHRGLFGVPKEVRDKIEAETRVMTIDNPVFMF